MKSALQNIQMPEFTVVYNEITDEEVVEVGMREGQEKKQREKGNKQVYNGTE